MICSREPQATSNAFMVPGSILLSWYTIDERNNFNTGINNLTVEYVNYKTGEATGLNVVNDTSNGSYISFDVSVDLWRVRANYTNQFEGSPPGKHFTTYSEVFVVYSDILHKFAADDASSTRGKTTGGSTRLRTISATGLKHVAV